MEKLIELLNEYEKEVKKDKLYEWEKSVCGPFHLFVRDIYDEHHIYSESADTYAISKKYGFIKRLVENDKIDLDKTGYKKADFQEVWNGDWRTVKGYEMLLMLLSISDTPIEDLVSYLI